MVKVLFVCLGNICRSPMAEGVFEKLVNDNHLADKIEIDSAGTAAYHVGELPDLRMRQTAKQFDINLTSRARQFTAEDFNEFDYILAMDKSNHKNIMKLHPGGNVKGEVILMRDFDDIDQGAEVPDPYYGGLTGFVDVYNILERSTTNLLNHIIDKHQLSDN